MIISEQRAQLEQLGTVGSVAVRVFTTCVTTSVIKIGGRAHIISGKINKKTKRRNNLRKKVYTFTWISE